MNKKKYMPPELEVSVFRLTTEILLGSIEHGPTLPAGGNLDDPPSDDDVLDWGGF